MTIPSPTKDRAINAVNIFLGLCLFLTPLLFGFLGEKVAAASAWLTGGLIGFVALIALTDLDEWEECINLTLGLWVIISPWLFGFASVTYAMWSHVVIGLAVAILAAIEIRNLHRRPPSKTM